MKRWLWGLAVLALGFGVVGQLQAAPIPGLFNTGVDASGTPLSDGTIGDPHYVMTSNPGGTFDIRVRTSVGGYPIPPWVGDDALSAWIGPNNDTEVDGPVGAYVYHTTFDLTGFNPATASIVGVWSTDNEGLDILLNGVSTGNSIPSDTSYTSFHPFSILSGFLPGLNSLDFIVNNDGGPTGLRVEMEGTASAVPEPATLTLAGFGLAGLCGYTWRRRKQPR